MCLASGAVGASLHGTPEVRAALAASTTDDVGVIVHVTGDERTREPLQRCDGSDGSTVRRQAVAERLESVLARLGEAKHAGRIEIRRRFALQPAFAARVDRSGLEQLLADHAVAGVELDRTWHADTAEGVPLIGADLLQAGGFGGSGTAVAIIDTGVDYLHPTLGGALLPTNLKVVRGLDTADNDADPMDCDGHGTAVASIAVGWSYQWNPHRRFEGGVAPDAKLLAYKASPDAACGTFTLSAVIAAIEDAIMHRQGDGWTLAAINLSLGGDKYAGPCDAVSPAYSLAVDDATTAGIAVVASAGNSGWTDAIEAPACFSNVISVGAAWDSEPGWVGYSFCLDGDCTRTCSDNFRPAQSIVCYSNSSPGLDVVAPSEYLTAARAGGTAGDFGGTSGAAPYVTGALALIAETRPELDPPSLRALLQLTGRSLFDDRNGLVLPLVEVSDAVEAATTAVGRPAGVIIPAGGTPVVSSAFVGQPVTIGSLRVNLRVAHSHPEDLTIRLRSPDGTVVRLHDHGPGTIADADGETRFGGLFASYPDRNSPVDPLGVLAGHSARGTWTLEVADTGTTVAPPTTPRLLDWAIAIEPHTPPALGSATARLVPVAARGPGVNGTNWTSEIRVLNPSATGVATATAWFVPSDASSGAAGVPLQTELRVPPLGVVVAHDLLWERLGVEAAGGQLIVVPDAGTITVAARTSTGSNGAGSFGQGVASVASSAAIGAFDAPALVLRLEESDSYRSNLGLSEVAGETATVEIQLVDGDSGEALGPPIARTLGPLGHVQLNRVLRAATTMTPLVNIAASLRVVAGQGRVLGYGSVIDNATGDAVYVPATVPTPAYALVIPVVARTDGRAGTHWRSDLRLATASSVPLELQLELRIAGADPALVRVQVEPGHVFATRDLLADLFGLDEGVGTLRIASTTGFRSPITATARVFNQTTTGTYGQLVSAVEHGAIGRLALGYVEGGAGFRTNVGIAEVAGAAVGVRVVVHRADGTGVAGEAMVAVPAYGMLQLDDVLDSIAQPGLERGWIELVLESGSGEITGYASVVDSHTGDAVFVDAIPID